jgi:hypothetical protein
MKELYFSTVFRYAPIDQAGELVKVDWETKKIEKVVPVGPKVLKFEDPNPRGNSRGGRGIAILDGKVVMASYCELQVYDLDLNPLFNISHNLMSGIHEIYHEGGARLWVVSTSLNCAILLDLNSGQLLDEIWPQEISTFQNRWGIRPRTINKEEDNRIQFLSHDIEKDPYHLHFNAYYPWKGERFGLFNRYGAVVNLTRNSVLFEDPKIIGAHNLIITDDGHLLVNDTRNQGVNVYNMNGMLTKRINLLPMHSAGKRVKHYKFLGPARKLLTRIGIKQKSVKMPFFVRGMDLHEELLFIGISPASVLCVNWITGELVDTFQYSQDVRKAVHGVKVKMN